MARQRTAKSHPHELHEVHEIRVGFEVFGWVGRFKGGRSWFHATPIEHDGKTYPAWYDDKAPSREAAERRALARWRERYDVQVFNRAQRHYQQKIDEANQRAHEAEQAAEEARKAAAREQLSHVEPKDLVEALDRLHRMDLADIVDDVWRVIKPIVCVPDEDVKQLFKESSLSIDDLASDELDELRAEATKADDLVERIRRVIYEPALRDRELVDLRYDLQNMGIYH